MPEPRTERTSALVRQTVLGTRGADGRRLLTLKEKTPTDLQATELAGLEAYENRRWFIELSRTVTGPER